MEDKNMNGRSGTAFEARQVLQINYSVSGFLEPVGKSISPVGILRIYTAIQVDPYELSASRKILGPIALKISNANSGLYYSVFGADDQVPKGVLL